MATITLGGTETHTAGDLPAVGAQAPDFELANAKLEPVRLSDFAGKRLVLSVLPSVDTGICNLQAKTFEARASEADNTVILTVSRDLPFRLGSYAAAEGTNTIQMASGFRSTFGEDYGVAIKDGKFATLYSRAIVVIDADGKVIYTEQVPEIGQEPDYDAAFAALS